jgi:hypothetical protein
MISHHYVVADFLCALKSGELRAGGDAAEVRWAALEELHDLEVSEVVRKVVQKARNHMQAPRTTPET